MSCVQSDIKSRHFPQISKIFKEFFSFFAGPIPPDITQSLEDSQAFIHLRPVPERRNNSIPGMNVPYFSDNFIPGINAVPERRNNAIKGINLG